MIAAKKKIAMYICVTHSVRYYHYPEQVDVLWTHSLLFNMGKLKVSTAFAVYSQSTCQVIQAIADEEKHLNSLLDK